MLELRNITKRFGSVLANDHINIKVDPGTIHAIIGENGAGKSTAMRIAYGFYTADSGEILVDGTVRRIQRPFDAIALGLGMVHQHFMLVETMTVAENIVLGAESGSSFALDLDESAARIRKLSDDFKLAVDPHAPIETLSVGQEQRVELLKALYRDARLLILDEPTAVLTPQEVDEFFLILRRMRDQGKTIVIITHKLTEVLAISEDVTVMRDGKVIGRLKTKETSAAELARLMVGRDVLLHVDKKAAQPGPAVLSVRGLSVANPAGPALPRSVDNVSFDVHAGEIVGVAGVEGNGQRELIESLAGLIDPARVTGQVTLDGTPLDRVTARRRRERGIAHIPEDRLRRGLLMEFALEENSILGVHYRSPIASGAILNDREIRRRTADIIQKFDVRPANAALPARVLSGGNQQKLIIGREFELQPRLLLVAQPTRGVDIGAIEFIHRKLVDLRDSGCAVLLVSAELEEVMSLSDRLLVIHQGRIAGEVDPARAKPAEIGLLMTAG
jgi:simple sugar transport system ATP-binding protein